LDFLQIELHLRELDADWADGEDTERRLLQHGRLAESLAATLKLCAESLSLPSLR